MSDDIKKIGDWMDVTFSEKSTFHFTLNRPGTVSLKITGRNWWGEKFLSYIVRYKETDLPVNKDGTSQF